MREPWEGDWCPAPNFRAHVRIIPVLRVRYDLHVQFPAGNPQRPLAGVDVVMPRPTWPEVLDFFASHGMTRSPQLAPVGDTSCPPVAAAEGAGPPHRYDVD